MKIEILHRYTRAVLYTSETADTIAEAIVAANSAGADLRGADLRGADLRVSQCVRCGCLVPVGTALRCERCAREVAP